MQILLILNDFKLLFLYIFECNITITLFIILEVILIV